MSKDKAGLRLYEGAWVEQKRADPLQANRPFFDAGITVCSFPALSGNNEWLAQIATFRSDPATGLTRKFHRRKLFLTNMGDADITCTTKFTGNSLNGRITQMAGIISHGPTVFTGMSHNKPPYLAKEKVFVPISNKRNTTGKPRIERPESIQLH
ncbi:MAG: hypothetical protein OEL83_01630 [Desulforhopalus sp.]|nr:hypothetical protein [Desulforhopalus sp.]